MHLRTFTSISLAAITAAAASLVACSSDDDVIPVTVDSGVADTGVVVTTDSGATPDSGVATGDAATTTSLYTRLGKESGIATAVDAIVKAELMDSDVASFFAPNGNPSHRPQPAEIEACLVIQLASAAGGPTPYTPGTTSVNPLDAGTPFMCRSMKDAHASLHIAGATFDKFVTIAAGVLTSAGVAPADITVIGGVLNGTKGDIVDADGGTTKFATAADAAAE